MPRRILEGVVVGNKADKTAVVRVERREMHPVYKKYIRLHKKYAAHDPENKCQVGQKVEIVEIAPVSKTKKWLVRFLPEQNA